MMNRFRNFMYGRYGTDQLNMFLWAATLALIIISFILRFFEAIPNYVHIILSAVSWVLLFLNILRSFSRKIAVRQKENYVFLRAWRSVKGFFKKLFVPRADRKTHKYFKCPTCSQKVRVPKGKGKIAIKCPKCGNKFIRKT